jgi:amino acid transporter
MAICGLGIIFTWLTVSLCHIRFRLALRAQGRSLEEVPFVAQSGLIGSIIAAGMLIFFLGLQFWVALYPIGAKPTANVFFQQYLGFFFFFLCYFGRKIYVRKFNEFTPLDQIDLDSGRSITDIDLLKQEIAEEKLVMASKPLYYRIYKILC